MLSNAEKSLRVKNKFWLTLVLSCRPFFILTLWLVGARKLVNNKYPAKRIQFILNTFFRDVEKNTGKITKFDWQRVLSSIGMDGGQQEASFASGFYRRMLAYFQQEKELRRYMTSFLMHFLRNEVHRDSIPDAHKVTSLTVDLTRQCNMHCKHCFADSTMKKCELIDIDRVIAFMHDAIKHGGCRFFAILGGEPLIEADRLMAMAKAMPYVPFVVFSNGTLLSEELCLRLKRYPNIAIFVSIEGFATLTDQVRGTRAFETANNALSLLRKHRMIYGVSVTATKRNYQEIVSDEFVRYLDEMGCFFTWIFDLKPVGRAATNETKTLVLTQRERDVVNEAVTRINKTAGFLYINTEKDPSVIGGCPAHRGTYMHISADGYATPCIAMRYYDKNVNIRDMGFVEITESPAMQAFRAIGNGEGCPSRFYPQEMKAWVDQNDLCYLYAPDQNVIPFEKANG